MKNHILPALCLIILCLVISCPSRAQAAPLDPDGEASLTLCYGKEGIAFPDLEIAVYRVAAAFPDGTYELIEPFASYPVTIHGITEQLQWKHTASTLSSYIIAGQVQPDREALTDGFGVVTLTGLQTGLYLVREAIADNTEGTYLFDPFMIYLPTPQNDGTFAYDVEAIPKCTKFIPHTKYTVTKLWKDEGNEKNRPHDVTVEIYRDGVMQAAQSLHAGNNWSYSWPVSADDPGRWTVIERSVPDGYKVSIQQNGSSFTILNSGQSQSETPDTGDTFSPLPWVLALSFSGLVLILLGIYGRRRRG